jgi:preprotein translocase subunit SecG
MQPNVRPFISLYVVLLIILVLSFGIKSLILGGHQSIRLEAAPSLSGAVSQGLFESTTATRLAQPGIDYTLAKTTYLQAGAWAVTTMKPIGPAADNGTLVLRKVGDAYQVVLGPGTSFSTAQTKSLPGVVTNFLIASGDLIYTDAD